MTFVPELSELFVEVIADDQRVPATEELAKHQVTVAREQPPVLSDRARDQDIVCNDLFVSRVVTENAQPAGESAEHGIGYEARRRLIGTMKSVHRREWALANPAHDHDSARIPRQ